MREVTGDLWTYPADVRVIPTNGCWTMRQGKPLAVMGASVAKEAARRYPMLPYLIGRDLRERGLHVREYAMTHIDLVAFPTKYGWRQKSDVELIRRSAGQLMIKIDDGGEGGQTTVVLPKVGCGLGGLSWVDVGRMLAGILDDRFVVVSRA